jgi:2-polyprenyl-3-methyl-5-hydroxy-6-metoxy-1,4-benzoquinol methylase
MKKTSNNDALVWNLRYKNPGEGISRGPNRLLINHLHLLPLPGSAVDFAMGLGWNAEILMKRNWDVVGVDVSYQAVKKAKARVPDLKAFVTDLTRFSLLDKKFDLVMNFNYLQRDLFANFEKMLRPRGMVMVETLCVLPAMKLEDRNFSPEHYLEPGELKSLFRDWEILLYVERENIVNGKPRGKSSLIARLPG